MSNHHDVLLPLPSSGEAFYRTAVQEIISSMMGNPNFPEPYPPPVPSMAETNAAFTTYLQLAHEVAARDLRKIGERDAAQAHLQGLLKRLGLYVELVADGDQNKLKSSGFPLRQAAVSNISTDPLPPPSDFSVKRGLISGSIEINFAKLLGARSYHVQISLATDPHDESGWHYATVSPYCQHIVVDGLTPLQNVWVRACGVGAGGNGLWTEPVRVTVL
jgi:hypothetical protein